MPHSPHLLDAGGAQGCKINEVGWLAATAYGRVRDGALRPPPLHAPALPLLALVPALIPLLPASHLRLHPAEWHAAQGRPEKGPAGCPSHLKGREGRGGGPAEYPSHLVGGVGGEKFR